jgi:hypothetical protein
MQADLAPSDNGFTQRANDLAVDLGLGAWAHCQALGLGERFEVWLDPGRHRALEQRPHLGNDALGAVRLRTHVLAAKQRHCSGQVGQLAGGDMGEPIDGASRQAPALWGLVRVASVIAISPGPSPIVEPMSMRAAFR